MNKIPATDSHNIKRRQAGENIWLSNPACDAASEIARWPPRELRPETLATEDEVGRAMLAELEAVAQTTDGDIVIALLGGRSAQAMHRLLAERAGNGAANETIKRLHVFTQDALAPLGMSNGYSFVRDFERLLGADFFRQVKSFTPMRTDAEDIEKNLIEYVRQIERLGGLDVLFLGHGPEPDDASHLAYIKPYAHATACDFAGIIPISPSILEHHIAKFKAGGSRVNSSDETECRRATHILTLGPAAILNAKRVVQSIVDADTAPAKRKSFRRVLETKFADDLETRARQLDENPGLWMRLHPNARCLITPNVLDV